MDELEKFAKDDERNCPDCRRLRKGLTWVCDPPKCAKHQNKTRIWRG